MPFNGAGTWTRLYNWVNDAANAVNIRADRMDAEMNDMSSGLSNAITRDGQGKPITTIDWNGQNLINVGTLQAANISGVTGTSSGVGTFNGRTGAVTLVGTDVSGAGGALSSALSAASGASLVGFQQAGTGSVSRTEQDKLRESVSVKDFGAVADGVTNDAAAFQAAINALPAAGGRIVVPDGAYALATSPSVGTRSVYFDIGVGVTFSGAGTVGDGSFPRAVSNISMLPVGPFIQSQSGTRSTTNNATASFLVENIQKAGTAGGTVGIYGGSQSANTTTPANQWAANFLVKAASGYAGGAWGIEVDVDSFSSAAGVTYFGIDITGIGSVNPDFGLIIRRADTTAWNVGIEVRNAGVGINMPGTNMTRGIVVNNPVVFINSVFSAKALANNSNVLTLQRFTDTAPTGYFLSLLDAANTQQIFTVDVLGNMVGNTVTAKGAAASTFNGALQLGGTTATTATAGTIAPPANVTGFMVAYLGNVQVKIPYYSA